MFINTNIVMVRHAEKPPSGKGLSQDGKKRAQAYMAYFQNYTINSKPVEWDYLFSSEDSKNSDRPRKTLKHLSDSLRMCINDTYTDEEYAELAEILHQPQFNNANILICWHHGKILKLAECLLGPAIKELPEESHWPAEPWPPCVFGWVLQLSFDENGAIIPYQTFCRNQMLMPDDPGKEPPVFDCPKKRG